MLILSVPHVQAIVGPLAATFVATVALTAWFLNRQEKDTAALRTRVEQQDEDLDRVWAWCMAVHGYLFGDDDPGGGPDDPPDPGPDDDGPSTDIAHPVDTEARKLALLHRYASSGQHRA